MTRRPKPDNLGPSAGALLTTKDVAALLRVHPKHVYRLMRRDLPALRVGDEWRFDRATVLSWAGARGATSGQHGLVPGLVAANGDVVVDELLRQCARVMAPPLGFVLTDHSGGAGLLQRRLVLAAGCHAGLEAPRPDDGAPPGAKLVRMQLVNREVGLATARGARVKTLAGAVGKRLAVRPATSGIRRRLDKALADAGIEARAAYRRSVEYACHRDVALAVARGDADAGLTTHAWAHAAGLSFLPIATEDYDLAFHADLVDDPRIVSLCEAAQQAAFRRRLRGCAGYDATGTGRVRLG
jgi:putative molybdopterin biosynthesis protein